MSFCNESMPTPLIKISNICKTYGETQILNNISLDVYAGEFLTLLGPSGCGKTTLLRIIAGFEQASVGDVSIDDVCINHMQACCSNGGCGAKKRREWWRQRRATEAKRTGSLDYWYHSHEGYDDALATSSLSLALSAPQNPKFLPPLSTT